MRETARPGDDDSNLSRLAPPVSIHPGFHEESTR